MIVTLRNPKRSIEIAGPVKAGKVVELVGANPESVLVLVDGELVAKDRMISDSAAVEVRPVISGG